MQSSYISKASLHDFCDGLGLCSVRKSQDGIVKIWTKDLKWNISEIPLESVINTENYNGKKIVRVYSSWHIFLSEDLSEVFLVTTEKEGKIQHQFTGGSPLEEKNKEVVHLENWVYKFDLNKVRENARIRTEIRTGVKITEEYNKKPLVDWVLMENEENGETYYKLVCLMHFIVKGYEGILNFTWKENTIDGKWYDIDSLHNLPNTAPNAYIVSQKAKELVKKKDSLVIISDFSKTLTAPTNPTTWSVFVKSWLLPETYIAERNTYYDAYHDYELAWNKEKTKEWWAHHLKLFIKYWLDTKLINTITKNHTYFAPREGLKHLFDTITKKKIEFFIISSWVSNFIESFLEQNEIHLDKSHIIGNHLIMNDAWKAIWYDINSIVTTLSKADHHLELEYYKKVVLLWDDESDLSMYSWDCLKIGFCDESIPWYDLYLWKNGSLEEVVKYIV